MRTPREIHLGLRYPQGIGIGGLREEGAPVETHTRLDSRGVEEESHLDAQPDASVRTHRRHLLLLRRRDMLDELVAVKLFWRSGRSVLACADDCVVLVENGERRVHPALDILREDHRQAVRGIGIHAV